MLIAPDIRSIEATRAPDAIATARRAAAARREQELVLARALLEVERARAYVFLGCASAAQFGQSLGLAAVEAHMLLDLGRVLELDPSIESRLREGTLTTPAAGAIARLLVNPDLRGEHDAWVERAESESLSGLRRAVRRRVAEIRCGESVVDVTVHVPESVDEGFHRAREIASEKAKRLLSRSETFEAVVDHYLDTFDAARRAEGTRRVGPTAERPHARYIPLSVRRAVRRRAADTCEFPACWHRRWLQFAHWDPHRDGSGREVNDLLLLCHTHHLLMDAEFFAKLGSPADPTFVGLDGIVMNKGSPGGRRPETEEERQAVRQARRSCSTRLAAG